MIILSTALAASLSAQGSIDFEQFTGPSFFTGCNAATGNPLTVNGVTFVGGQILTNTGGLPADETTVYGTANFSPGCANPITFTFAEPATNVSFLLLNGQPATVSYVVVDNQGQTHVVTLPANFAAGSSTVTIQDSNIVSVTIISASLPFDFFIDNIVWDVSYQIAYAVNLTIGDSYINVTNAGTRGGYDAGDIFGRPFGGVCVNAYFFDPNEELLSCCSCYVSPNGLHSFSLQKDFLANLLTPGTENAGTVLLVTSGDNTGATCTNSAATWTTPERGVRAWMSTLHNNTSIGPSSYQITEHHFEKVSLSGSEVQKVQSLCGTIVTNGSKHGICNSCPEQGLSSAKQ
jgi:hypothetical protein